jgi:hypothetical protein
MWFYLLYFRRNSVHVVVGKMRLITHFLVGAQNYVFQRFVAAHEAGSILQTSLWRTVKFKRVAVVWRDDDWQTNKVNLVVRRKFVDFLWLKSLVFTTVAYLPCHSVC